MLIRVANVKLTVLKMVDGGVLKQKMFDFIKYKSYIKWNEYLHRERT